MARGHAYQPQDGPIGHTCSNITRVLQPAAGDADLPYTWRRLYAGPVPLNNDHTLAQGPDNGQSLLSFERDLVPHHAVHLDDDMLCSRLGATDRQYRRGQQSCHSEQDITNCRGLRPGSYRCRSRQP
jgi:hypothetical protein